LGDGNLHYNVSAAANVFNDRFFAQQPAIYECVHDQVTRFSGSISAEHGIGQLKRAEFARLAPPGRIHALRAIKQALDPLGIMNPGKLVP
jgi:FAD/FMN-containing dehydrogenase